MYGRFLLSVSCLRAKYAHRWLEPVNQKQKKTKKKPNKKKVCVSVSTITKMIYKADNWSTLTDGVNEVSLIQWDWTAAFYQSKHMLSNTTILTCDMITLLLWRPEVHWWREHSSGMFCILYSSFWLDSHFCEFWLTESYKLVCTHCMYTCGVYVL